MARVNLDAARRHRSPPSERQHHPESAGGRIYASARCSGVLQELHDYHSRIFNFSSCPAVSR